MNLQQIANKAGVSHTAVSLALRGKAGVGDQTRKRILDLARELGYQRHGPASALVSGKTDLIGVVPGWTHPMEIGDWDRRIINGLGRILTQGGKNIVFLLEPCGDDVPSVIGQRYVDGTVFLMQPHPSVAEWMADQRIPMVTANFAASDGMDCVMHDDEAAVRLAIEHLASLGHRRIAYINSKRPEPHHDPSSGIRLDTYRDMMDELGLDTPPDAEKRQKPEERLDELHQGKFATAFLCYNDEIAMGVIQWLWERGIRVPDHVSVMGIDDMFSAAWATPALTTIRLPFEKMGERTGELLLARIAKPGRLPIRELIAPKLIQRQSTAPPSLDKRKN